MSLFRTLLSQLSSSRLPSEYQEVEWIKGTGTQYIDLDLSGVDGMICEYDASYDSDYTTLNVDGGYIIGSHGTNYPYGRNGGWYKKYNNSWELGYGESYPSSYSAINYGQKYHVKFCTFYNEAYIEVDGTKLINASGQNVTNNSVYVFTHGYNLAYGYACTIATLYGAKISKIVNNELTLLRDLVPCYRKSDSAIGLYDLVEGKFYGNSGSGKFLCYPTPPTPPRVLPDEYQEVEYVHGNNSAYIDTGFQITTGIKFEIDISLSSISEQYLIGAVYLGSPVIRSHLACFNNGGYQFGLGAKEDIWTNFRPTSNTRYVIEASTISGNNYININGTNYGTNTYTYTLSNMNCYVGAVNGLDMNRKIKGNIYSCKIYDQNETLVRDLIPCYRKIDNKTGMYDLVEGNFYTSATSTNFSAGPNVN